MPITSLLYNSGGSTFPLPGSFILCYWVCIGVYIIIGNLLAQKKRTSYILESTLQTEYMYTTATKANLGCFKGSAQCDTLYAGCAVVVVLNTENRGGTALKLSPIPFLYI